MSKLILNSLFVFSEQNNKFFHTKFGPSLNVIHGRNTSGKSTLIQLILFAFGINDDIIRLSNILSEEIFVRLDAEVIKAESHNKLTIIRKDDVIFIRLNDNPALRFTGIGANQSNEHVKLKDFMSDLFDFNLVLESKSGISKASLETMFLPYYVAQSVGWVYLRKSFSNLDFYRNFKEDYLDYYLGIESYLDRVEKRELENRLLAINEKIKLFGQVNNSNVEIKLSRLIEETFVEATSNYVKNYSEKHASLTKLDTDYVNKCNQLSYYTQRLAVISKVKRNQNKQMPGENKCPVCTQLLPSTPENIYKHFQSINDTENELVQFKEKAKKLQSDINSLERKIQELRGQVSADYNILIKYQKEDISLDTWLESKANIKLSESITNRLGQLLEEQLKIREQLNLFKTEEDIKIARGAKSASFEKLFKLRLSEMDLPNFEEERFTKLYEISSFPFQGVELLQTVMCYHFAFNNLISYTPSIHRFPFILDGVFKEDVDGVNRVKILKFIQLNKPADTQTIISIADAKEQGSNINEYNDKYFHGEAKLICIGDGIKQKAILNTYNGEFSELLEDSFVVMEEF